MPYYKEEKRNIDFTGRYKIQTEDTEMSFSDKTEAEETFAEFKSRKLPCEFFKDGKKIDECGPEPVQLKSGFIQFAKRKQTPVNL